MQGNDAAGGARGLGLKAAMAAEELKQRMQMGGGWKEAEVMSTGPDEAPVLYMEHYVMRSRAGAAKLEAAAACPQLLDSTKARKHCCDRRIWLAHAAAFDGLDSEGRGPAQLSTQ